MVQMALWKPGNDIPELCQRTQNSTSVNTINSTKVEGLSVTRKWKMPRESKENNNLPPQFVAHTHIWLN